MKRVYAILASISCVMLLGMPANAKQVQLDVAMANPTMFVSAETEDGKNTKGENYLRIGLTGFELPDAKERLPINVSIVIDKSGSMQGESIQQARKAAVQAIDRLRDDDIISIVAYDSSVTVVLPATKASDRELIKEKIRSIKASGNTALFAGVSKGAAEIRKFLDDKRVNRVILLSDGRANIGPSTPHELGQLGESLIKDGISVSTMGLGLSYNEDLMTRLAMASSGNHVFIEDAENLVQVFQNEFDDVLSVVAQKIQIEAVLGEGIRPVKVLNYPADIVGQKVVLDLGQLYARQQRFFVVEVEVALGESGSKLPAADVSLNYMNLITETKDKLTSSVEIGFSDKQDIAYKSIDKAIMGDCVIQIANERNRRATKLRDDGNIEQARELLLFNAAYLGTNFKRYGLPQLQLRCVGNSLQAESLAPEKWAENRKTMIEDQYQDSSQQRFSGKGKSNFNKR